MRAFKSALILASVLQAITPAVQAETYASSITYDKVLVYADDADGNAAPLRVIIGPNTQIDGPGGLAVDSLHGELFVSCYNTTTIKR